MGQAEGRSRHWGPIGMGIIGMWPCIGSLILGAGPTGMIPGGGGPITGIMGGPPPCGVLASSLGKGVLGGWGEVGSLPLPEEEQSGIEGTCPC